MPIANMSDEIRCPSCGEPWTIDQKECNHCGRPVVLQTMKEAESVPAPQLNKFVVTLRQASQRCDDEPTFHRALAFCYLRLKLYDKAAAAFDRAMEEEFDNPETYFYAAVCLLGGKKAFQTPRPTIDKIEEYVNAAIELDPRGIFYYFLAYIRYDHHKRKFYNVSPNWQQYLAMARQRGVTERDIQQLFALLCVPRPEVM